MRSRWRGSMFGVVFCVVCCCGVFAAGASAAGSENRDLSCPASTVASPGYRAFLPDCRAYELVSPVYEQGFPLNFHAVSEDGDHLLTTSLGGFAGLEGGDLAEGGLFELSRVPSRWEVTALSLATPAPFHAAVSPSASRFPVQTVDASSPDLSTTLLEDRTASESPIADNFSLRQANGEVTAVGPMLPASATAGVPAGEFDEFIESSPDSYVDASSDLLHVFYRMAKPPFIDDEWPGDSTIGRESLLEYSGTGNIEPELVGVKPGPREAVTRVGESPELVSTCGTSLGSLGNNDLYNAVSDDGDTVFFTAEQGPCHETVKGIELHGSGPEVNELYARLGERESVAVSEPSVGACEVCDTSVKAPAEFAGASRDGSKVFFLTSQELLAGASGPNLYEYDFDNPAASPGDPDGKIVPVALGSAAPEVQGVARVSEDGSHVYFVARGVLTSEPDRSLAPGHQEAVAGADNLYVFERDARYPAGHVSFIAVLCSGKEESGALTGVSQCPSPESDTRDWGFEDARAVQATPDGRFVVFQSVADLLEGDTLGEPQVFEYDSLTGELARVSRGASNDEPQSTESADLNPAEIEPPRYLKVTSPTAAGTGLAVSADGAMVVFASAGALTVGSEVGATGRVHTAGQYEYRSAVGEGGTISDGDVYLISQPVGSIPLLDESGQDVFFTSGESLVPQDTDSQFDIYDARVGGGFPAPVVPVECGGAGCAPPVASVSFAAPGIEGLAGGGNLAPPPPPPPVKPGPTVSQRLAAALKVCRRDRRKVRRVRCEKAAHKKFHVAGKASEERGAGR